MARFRAEPEGEMVGYWGRAGLGGGGARSSSEPLEPANSGK